MEWTTIEDFLKENGEALLSALGFKECKEYYGLPFVRWYNTYHIFSKVEVA